MSKKSATNTNITEQANHLPSQWCKVKSEQGEIYYWNVATSETQWERPKIEIGSLPVSSPIDDFTTTKLPPSFECLSCYDEFATKSEGVCCLSAPNSFSLIRRLQRRWQRKKKENKKENGKENCFLCISCFNKQIKTQLDELIDTKKLHCSFCHSNHSKVTLIKHLTNANIELFLTKTTEQVTKEVRQQEKLLYEKKMKNEFQKNDLVRRSDQCQSYIEEEIMTLRCPNPTCRKAFFDFNGCVALKCGNVEMMASNKALSASGCGSAFCGICFENFSPNGDAHAHCKSVHGKEYFSTSEWLTTMQKYKQKLLIQYWETKVSTDLQIHLIKNESVMQHFDEVGLKNEMKPSLEVPCPDWSSTLSTISGKCPVTQANGQAQGGWNFGQGVAQHGIDRGMFDNAGFNAPPQRNGGFQFGGGNNDNNGFGFNAPPPQHNGGGFQFGGVNNDNNGFGFNAPPGWEIVKDGWKNFKAAHYKKLQDKN